MHEPQTYPTDEITLRDLILKGRDLWAEVWRYKHIPIVLALIGAAWMTYTYVTYKPPYPAVVTFSVDEDETGSGSGLSGLLGQFGLGSMRPSRYNLDKILALSKSRRVIQEAFFGRVEVDGKIDYLANHLIREYELPATNQEKGAFAFTHDSLPIFSRAENEMLLAVYHLIIGPPDNPKKALVSADYNEDSNIMSLEVATTHEVLSYELANRLFEALSSYYVTKSVEKQRNTYEVVKEKRDSVLNALRSAELQLAQFKDRNRGLLLRADQISEFRLQREITALSSMYAEVVKNTEIADFSLRTKTPFIQVIDAPIYPIYPALLSLPRKIIIGLFLGGLLGVVYVVGRRVVRDAMAA